MKTLLLSLLLCSSTFLSAQDSSSVVVFGLLPPTEEDLRQTPFSPSFSIPPDYHLPAVTDLSGKMPPVGNQGYQGSCAAWATAYGLKSYLGHLQNNQPYSGANMFSPTFVYNLIKLNRMPGATECTSGITFREAFNTIQDVGSVSLNDLPYEPFNNLGCLAPNPRNNTALLQKARNNRFASWQRLLYDNPDEIKYYVSSGIPVVIGMMLDQSFADDGYYAALNNLRFVWKPNDNAELIGYHAMLCAGYDENRKEFLVLNSWGQRWGNNGYMYVPYDKFYKFLREAYIAYDAITPGLITNTFQPTDQTGAQPTQTNEFSSLFKKGQYQEFDSLRFGLAYLSKDSSEIIVKFTDMRSRRVIQSILYARGEEKSFFLRSRKISFRFNKVAKADGSNDLAVFFTLKILVAAKDPNIDKILDKFNTDRNKVNKNIQQLLQLHQQMLHQQTPVD